MNKTELDYNWLLETEKLCFADVGYYIGFYVRHRIFKGDNCIVIKQFNEKREVVDGEYVDSDDEYYDPDDEAYYYDKISIYKHQFTPWTCYITGCGSAKIVYDENKPLYFDYEDGLYEKYHGYNNGSIAENMRLFKNIPEIVYYVDAYKIKVMYKFLLSINQKILPKEILYIIACNMI